MDIGIVLEPELERFIEEKQNDYDALLQESIMESTAEIDLKEQVLTLLRKSIEECRIKKQAQELRLHSLEIIIEERNKMLEAKEKQVGSIQRQLNLYCRDIDAKEREYSAIRRNVEERKREFEVKGERLKSLERDISECEKELRLKEEECNWQHGIMHQLITEREEIRNKMQREIEECDNDFGVKKARLCLIEDLMREREQELKEKDIEFHNILRDCEWKEEELRVLLGKIVECSNEMKRKEEELDAMQRLINGQGKELEFKRKNLLKSMRLRINQLVQELQSNKKEFDSLRSSMNERSLELEKKEKQLGQRVKDLESMKKQFEGQVKEFAAKERQFEGRVKELESKQKQFEGRVKELEPKEKQFEIRAKEFESKEKQFERRVKGLEVKEKQFEGQAKDLESKKNQHKGEVKVLELKEAMFKEQQKELESKEKQLEGQMKDLESKKNQCEGQLKDLEFKKKQFEGQMKELELKKRLFEGQVKDLELKKKQFGGQVKELESKQNQFEGQLKELELKQRQYESLRKSSEEEKLLKEKSNSLLLPVKTEHLYFTDTNSVNNGSNLQLLSNLLKKYELVCSQVNDALRTSSDPTKLVLDTIKGFCPTLMRQESVEFDVNILRGICNLLMDELKKSSPVFGIHVKQEAMKLASDWKANIAVADKDCLEVLNFLKFVATYEIGLSFDENELQRLLGVIAQHCQAPQALGHDEKLPDKQLSPTTTDGRNLQLLSNEPELMANDILVDLQTSSDPAKLVLDIIQNPIVPQNRMGNEGVIIDGSHIFLLDQLMRISPHIEPHVRGEAMKLALDLKANMSASAENSLVVLGFLLILSIYGLVSSFDKDEILKLLEFAAEHKQTVELFGTLGFVDKISDFVQNLITKKQHIEAVRFICAYNLADKIQPVDLLRQHMERAKRIFKRFGSKKKCTEKKVKAKDLEIAVLDNVLQCISDNNLESQDLVNEIQDRIVVLQMLKEKIASEPPSKVVVQQPEEKKSANEAVTKNQVKVQQPEEKKRANVAVSKKKDKAQQSKKMKRANRAATKNPVKVQVKKPANGAVTMNQFKVPQTEENKYVNEALTTNQVQVQQSQEKKRGIEAVPDNYQLNQSVSNSKRPRTASTHSVPSVFNPQYQHAFIPSGMPPQFGLPPSYFGLVNPASVGRFANSGPNYFSQPRPYPPFR